MMQPDSPLFPEPDKNSAIRDRRRQGGSAMVTALAMVVLMTVVVVSLLLQVRSSNMLTDSRNERIVTDAVILGVGDYAVGRLLTVISNNMNASTNGTIVPAGTPFGSPGYFYQFTSTNAGAQLLKNGNTNFANLVMQSINSGNYPDPRASGESTTNSGGRPVAAARWDQPKLNLTGFSGVAGVSPPNWIYLSSSANNPLSTNLTASTVTRFAYNIYDTSGLLDINAMGTSLAAGNEGELNDPDLVDLLGTMAGGDLMAVGFTAGQAANFAEARTNGAGTDSGRFPNAVNFAIAALRKGYTNAYVTNFNNNNVWYNPITSRQDLLRYLDYQNINPDDTAYFLTHFSRHVNAPAWGPMADGTGANFQYRTDANDTDSVNRFAPYVTALTTFPRLTGENAVIGESLIKYRFPLSRLAWIGPAGNNVPQDDLDYINGLRLKRGLAVLSQADLIELAFGLRYDGGAAAWEYIELNGDRNIMTLEEVRNLPLAQAREPNFFELLKAGILRGSLGQAVSITDSFVPVNANNEIAQDLDADRQIFQIGANAVDQADTDSVSTTIQVTTEDGVYLTANNTGILGVENTPRIYGISFVAYRKPIDPAPSDGNPYTNPNVYVWMQPVLWNPQGYNEPAASTVGAKPNLPENLKVQVLGGTVAVAYCNADGSALTIDPGAPTPTVSPASRNFGGLSPQDALKNIDRSVPEYRRPVIPAGAGPSAANVAHAESENEYTETVPASPSSPSASNPSFRSPSPATGLEQIDDSYIGIPCGVIYNAPDRTTPGNETGAASVAMDLSGDKAVKVTLTDVVFQLRYTEAVNGSDIIETLPPISGEFMLKNPVPHPIPGNTSSYANPNYGPYLLRIDPRTTRFGPVRYNYTTVVELANGVPGVPTPKAENDISVPAALSPSEENPIRFDAPTWADSTTSTPLVSPTDWTVPGAAPFQYGVIADNVDASAVRYEDPDGVQRQAEAVEINGADNPFYTDNVDTLPLVMNRPFYSTGALGYVFRDVPWKNLDMFSENSADSGLLDFFSVYEEPAITGGKLNVNTAYPQVLSALMNNNSHLQDANLNVGQTGTTTYAQNFLTNSIKLRSVSDVVNVWAAGQPWPVISGTQYSENLKARSELVTRGVASEAGMRTWNFLIDVIAQTGDMDAGTRFSGTVTDTSRFMINGERRLWIHVAIDRVTGKVIAKEVEPVIE